MNERIKELVEHAGFIRFSPDKDPYTPIDWSCDYTEELEKFAELIVRECVGVISDAVDHREPASTYAHKILNHFGIDNDDVADNPQDMLEFLAGRMEFAGIAEPVAKSYAKNIRKILKQHFGVE